MTQGITKTKSQLRKKRAKIRANTRYFLSENSRGGVGLGGGSKARPGIDPSPLLIFGGIFLVIPGGIIWGFPSGVFIGVPGVYPEV